MVRLVVSLTGQRAANGYDKLLQRFTSNMSAKAGTITAYGHVVRNLRDYFTDIRPLESITPGDADDFKSWLGKHENLSTATVNRRITAAKTIFRKGLRWNMVNANPFDGIHGGGQTNEARKQFVPLADVAKVLDVCPDVQWRVLVALSRYGGLRIPSEALPLTWQDVN